MNSGFTMIEMLFALSIGFVVMVLGVTAVSQAGGYTEKLRNDQQRIESLFNMVDLIKSDLLKCGIRLGETDGIVEPFCWEDDGFKLIYGFYEEFLKKSETAGGLMIKVRGNNQIFSRGCKVIIYDQLTGSREINVIEGYTGGYIELGAPLHKDYGAGSLLICLKTLEYRWFIAEKCLKRKVDNGFFQPLIEEVTAFDVSYINDYKTVQYKVEINSKEQLQSFVFLNNLKEK